MAGPLRGQFLRGWNHGAGVDPEAADRKPAKPGGNSGDHPGSVQTHALASHNHQEMVNQYNGGGNTGNTNAVAPYVSAANPDILAEQFTANTGGPETRPTNVAVSSSSNCSAPPHIAPAQLKTRGLSLVQARALLHALGTGFVGDPARFEHRSVGSVRWT
jgi:hypothetical protein